MKRLRYSLLVLLWAFFAADAGEVAAVKTAGIHVDIDAVVATGEISPVDGVTASGQPDEAALHVISEAGYSTVIDLRGPDENRGLDDERASVEAVGMDYVSLPVVGSDAINFETAKALDRILGEAEGPVLVHCGSGNRVGAVLALRHRLQGAGVEESVALGKDAGLTRLEGVVRDRLTEE